MHLKKKFLTYKKVNQQNVIGLSTDMITMYNFIEFIN